MTRSYSDSIAVYQDLVSHCQDYAHYTLPIEHAWFNAT